MRNDITNNFQIVEAANETVATAMYMELSSECTPETCVFLGFQTYLSWQGTVLHTLLACLSVSFYSDAVSNPAAHLLKLP